VLLTLAVLFLLMFVLAHGIIRGTMFRSFEAHEIADGEEQAERLLAALDQELHRLERTARDWADWDETHEFLQDRNPRFVEDNLYPDALVNLDANLMAFADAEGRRRALASVRSVTGTPLDPPREVLRLLGPEGAWLDAHRADEALRGYVSTGIGLLAFVAMPVHRSGDSATPSAGALVIGRYLDTHLVAELRVGTRTALEVHDLAAPDLPADVARAVAAIGARHALARPLDERRLGVYAALRDLWGEPVGIVRVIEPRSSLQLARETEWQLLLARLLVGALICGFIWFIVHRRVLLRVRRLDEALLEVSRGGTDARVPDLGYDDELTRLGRSVNELLDELQARQDAREARDAALTASRLKSDFLATLSQEIRQPLNGVLGALDVALERELSPQVRARLDDAYRAAIGLVALLNDVLDYQKVNPAARGLDESEFDLRALVEDIAALFAPRAAQHGLALNCYVDPKVARVYRGDQHRLRQVLANLVDNAIKFTLRGEVGIRASLMGRRADADSIVLSVVDTGIGFSPGQLSSFFDGVRGEERPGGRVGSGLGLSVAKQLVTQLGGLLDVDSALGRGSRVSAALRLQRVDEGSIGLFDQHAGRQALLLGEDSGCVTGLADYLTAMGLIVTRVSSPAEIPALRADFVVAPLPDLAALPTIDRLPVIAVLPPGTPPSPFSPRLVQLTWPVQLHALQRAVSLVCTPREDEVPELGAGI